MQLGFVIDHSRCIGCHACTVACKSENSVPLGKFRTWVKYVETGEFPAVRRSFAVLRCNQCTAAPCVEICPVGALEKRADGIVDVDPRLCIGCKACMQACPYDALYLNDSTGVAEKCHFCAHRVEQGLAPACAVVCPTEAIIPGDFDDPESVVSRLLARGALAARKVEAGTRPNVYYKEANAAALDPGATRKDGRYMWASSFAPPVADPDLVGTIEGRARDRTVYDIDCPAYWGWKVSAYLWTKSLAAGAFLVGAPLALASGAAGLFVAASALALGFLALTMGLLVADLKRPGRFLLVLLHPNRRSWLFKGALVLAGYGATLTVSCALAIAWWRGWISGVRSAHVAAAAVTGVFALLAAIYSAWLFGQAKGRVLWMKRGFALQLAIQAAIAGSAFFAALHAPLGLSPVEVTSVCTTLGLSLAAHLAILGLEGRMAPRAREEEFRRAVRFTHKGPLARRLWGLGVGLGIVAPAILVGSSGAAVPVAIAGALALAGLFVAEDVFVRAGQALPIH